MPISFVFLVIFLVIQTCGKMWCSQVASCVGSCVVLNLPCQHPLLSSLHPCMQLPCAAVVWDCGWHREHEEWHTLCRGAHDAHQVVCPAAIPEQFHLRRGPSSNLYDKLAACPALVQISRQQPESSGEAPCILKCNQLSLHVNNQLCPDMPVLPGGTLHMRPHQASVPCGYVLWG